MNQKQIVLNLISKNNGLLFAKQARHAGVDNKTLQRMNGNREIERIEHGLYIDPRIIEDEYLVAQYRCRKGIFSHDTALYFNDLSDRIPFKLTMSIPSNYNTRLLNDKENYKFFYISKENHDLGKIVLKSPYGNNINVYNKERTVCDCILKRKVIDKAIIINAIKVYILDTERDYSKLLEYASIFRISNIVQQYLEVLS